MIYFKLFITFFKLGLFTFGGGYAMLSILEKEIIEKNKWAIEEELLDYYALSQVTPGIIAVNVATFVGYKIKKRLGAIVSVIGMIFPSFIIIALISFFYKSYSDIQFIESGLKGIRIAVTAMLIFTVINMAKKSIIDKFTFTIFLLCLILTMVFKLPVIYIILIALFIGVISYWSKK